MPGILAEVIIGLFGFMFPVLHTIMERVGSRGSRPTYAQRLHALTGQLTSATTEVDRVLEEMGRVAQERQRRVEQLEEEIQSLEATERERAHQIDALMQVDPAVAQHLLALLQPSEKRSARRDYMLFGAGIVVSAAISVMLNLAGLN